jgi:hypothetical protein
MIEAPVCVQDGTESLVRLRIREQSARFGRRVALSCEQIPGVTLHAYRPQKGLTLCGMPGPGVHEFRLPVGAQNECESVLALHIKVSATTWLYLDSSYTDSISVEFPIGEADFTLVYRACEDDPGWYELQN